jgi:hypothetical protein
MTYSVNRRAADMALLRVVNPGRVGDHSMTGVGPHHIRVHQDLSR